MRRRPSPPRCSGIARACLDRHCTSAVVSLQGGTGGCMQDRTHRVGREMMHWGLWPARGELVKPQSGARGRRARPWPSDAARPSRVRVAPRALRRTIVGLKPTQQPQPPNSIFFILSNTIGSELRGPFFTVKLLTCQGSILYRQTFGPPHGSTSL